MVVLRVVLLYGDTRESNCCKKLNRNNKKLRYVSQFFVYMFIYIVLLCIYIYTVLFSVGAIHESPYIEIMSAHRLSNRLFFIKASINLRCPYKAVLAKEGGPS